MGHQRDADKKAKECAAALRISDILGPEIGGKVFEVLDKAKKDEVSLEFVLAAFVVFGIKDPMTLITAAKCLGKGKEWVEAITTLHAANLIPVLNGDHVSFWQAAFVLANHPEDRDIVVKVVQDMGVRKGNISYACDAFRIVGEEATKLALELAAEWDCRYRDIYEMAVVIRKIGIQQVQKLLGFVKEEEIILRYPEDFGPIYYLFKKYPGLLADVLRFRHPSYHNQLALEGKGIWQVAMAIKCRGDTAKKTLAELIEEQHQTNRFAASEIGDELVRQLGLKSKLPNIPRWF